MDESSARRQYRRYTLSTRSYVPVYHVMYIHLNWRETFAAMWLSCTTDAGIIRQSILKLDDNLLVFGFPIDIIGWTATDNNETKR